MTLVRTGPHIRDYLEVEVHDDLDARVHIYELASVSFRHTPAEAQHEAMAFSVAARRRQPYRLNGYTFVLNPTQETP